MSSLRNDYRDLTRGQMSGDMLTSRGFEVSHGDHISQMSRAMTYLNELRVTQRTPVISLNAIYPLSIFNDVVFGTVTHQTDRYAIAPSSRLETAELGYYEPGFTAEAGKGIIMDADAEGRWGIYTALNGFFAQYTEANGIQVGLRRSTVDTLFSTNDPEFIDKLDGTGYSGITYDREEGYIFQVDFNYYGFGAVVFSIMKRDSLEDSTMYPFAVVRINKNTSTANPNLPVTVENLGSVGNVYCTGRQYSIIGKINLKKRKTGVTSNIVTLDDTGFKPIASFRRRLGDEFAYYSVLNDAINFINGTSDVEYELLLGGTLTGAVPFIPTNRSAGETAVEFDISATAITGGEVFYSNLISGSGKNNERVFESADEERPIPRNLWVTLVGRTVAPATTSDVRAHLGAKEQW